MKSLPLGNGRLGAMVYGGVETETIGLNESTMWSGEYDEHQQRPLGREKLDEIRKLFFEGNLAAVSYTHLDVYKRQIYKRFKK